MIKYTSDSKVFSKDAVIFYFNGDAQFDIEPETMSIEILSEHVAFLQRTSIFLQSIIDKKKKIEIYDIQHRINELKKQLHNR